MKNSLVPASFLDTPQTTLALSLSFQHRLFRGSTGMVPASPGPPVSPHLAAGGLPLCTPRIETKQAGTGRAAENDACTGWKQQAQGSGPVLGIEEGPGSMLRAPQTAHCAQEQRWGLTSM